MLIMGKKIPFKAETINTIFENCFLKFYVTFLITSVVMKLLLLKPKTELGHSYINPLQLMF